MGMRFVYLFSLKCLVFLSSKQIKISIDSYPWWQLGDKIDMKSFLSLEPGLPELADYTHSCWVNVECPDEDDFLFLTRDLGIPREFLSDIADIDERPRAEREDEWLLTILRIPMDGGGQGMPYQTVPIGIITGHEATVSVCYRRTQMLPDFINHIRRKNIQIAGQREFITRMIYSSAVWFLKYLKLMYLEINRAEKELEQSIRNEDLLRIMRLQRSLVYFSTSIRGNEAMLGRLRTTSRASSVDPDLFEDVSIELRQAYNTINIYTDIVTSMMDASANIISNNVNTIMKRMTSISIVLTIPTMISSFFGMNVNVYLGEWYWAFLIIFLVSAAISSLALYLFRRIKWF